MRVSITGWTRNTNALARLVDRAIKPENVAKGRLRSLSDVKVGRSVYVGDPYFDSDNISVSVKTGARIETSGNFELTVQLSRQEILILAREVLRDCSLDQFVEMMGAVHPQSNALATPGNAANG